MSYLKLLELEMKLDNCLNDISGYAESACDYLMDSNSKLDKDEVVMYLSSIPEYVEEVKELTQKIEEEYEQERSEQNE